MKKADNRVIKFLVVISFVFSVFFLTPGLGNKTHAHAHGEGDVHPTEVGPCYLYGVHKMYAKGTATVRYKGTNTNAITLGTMYRCACRATIVLNGRPPSGQIGKYATDPTLVASSTHSIYETPRSNVKSTTSSSLPGYRFY